MFILYDERALIVGTDESSVLGSAESIEEARDDARALGFPCHIYEYDVEKGNELTNERFVESVY